MDKFFHTVDDKTKTHNKENISPLLDVFGSHTQEWDYIQLFSTQNNPPVPDNLQTNEHKFTLPSSSIKKTVTKKVDSFSHFLDSDNKELIKIIEEFDAQKNLIEQLPPKRRKEEETIIKDPIDFRVTDLFKTPHYQQEISQIFDNFQYSINHQDPVNREFSTTFSNFPELNTDDFLTEKTNIGDAIRKTLTENAGKPVEYHGLVNKTQLWDGHVTFHGQGPFFDLPEKVFELIKFYKGISNLYDWQKECLNLPAVKNRKNLVYALPTSGGKTLVAEILMLRELMCRKRNALFVLPYVAIVQEKVGALAPFGVALDFLVEEYAAGKGCLPPRRRRYKNSVYVATIEKALGLINSLVEAGRMQELGLVVIDELHLVGEDRRGATLEALLTKIIYLKEDVHIVGMSATIGNLPDIGKFLHAEIYTGNFRPVELTEYIKCGEEIAKIDLKSDDIFQIVKKPTFSYSKEFLKIDPDHLGGLVMEVVPVGSCLIFCSTKKGCENVTQLLCRVMFPYVFNAHDRISHVFVHWMVRSRVGTKIIWLNFRNVREYKVKAKQALKKALQEESPTVCKILQKSIEFGVAYHHSGLTAEERRLIEDGFRNGTLCVLCCTSTLAAGVNLPAKRVIIRKPYIGQDFITLSRYKQMVGRAGRAGMGEIGESILICNKNEIEKVRKLLLSPMNQAHSTLHNLDAIGLRHLFLSCIGLGVATTRKQLHDVASTSLLAVQQQNLNVNLKKVSDGVIKELFVLGALEANDNSKESKLIINHDSKLKVSKLGSAVIKGGLELSKAHYLYDDLVEAQSSLVLINCLHLLYLVTPYDSIEQIRPSKTLYYSIIMKLGEKERKTAKVLGIDESCAHRLYSNGQIKTVPERVLNRFYIALMLYDLWNQSTIASVSEKYEVERGIVQNLMTSTASFASNAAHFCEELPEFWAFAGLFKGMSEKLSHCCIGELVPLMDLPAVKQGRAKQLYKAGYKTIQSIAKANPNDLVEIVEFLSKMAANQIIAGAKLLLLEKVETLREEAEDVVI